MKQTNKKLLYTAIGFLSAFVLWTLLVKIIDVQTIGPLGSSVGFASLNGLVHKLTGVHWWLYNVTDLLSLIPFAFAAGFGVFGLIQWIKRKSLFKVDRDIIALGVFYATVIALYLAFEVVVVNYRPVLIEGMLEASYPSSTTVLVASVIPTAIMQFAARVKNRAARLCVCSALAAFAAFMVIGRLISGVHWFSDIVGGALLSTGLVTAYCSVAGLKYGERKTRA